MKPQDFGTHSPELRLVPNPEHAIDADMVAFMVPPQGARRNAVAVGERGRKRLKAAGFVRNPPVPQSQEKRVRACGSDSLFYLTFLVGVKGFEPSTPCTPCKCATKLRHTPKPAIIAG
jgi:hypothetical protein